MGILLEYALGGPRDDVQAYAWYDLAAASGFESAGRNRDYVLTRLRNQDAERADRLAGEYRDLYATIQN